MTAGEVAEVGDSLQRLLTDALERGNDTLTVMYSQSLLRWTRYLLIAKLNKDGIPWR